MTTEEQLKKDILKTIEQSINIKQTFDYRYNHLVLQEFVVTFDIPYKLEGFKVRKGKIMLEISIKEE